MSENLIDYSNFQPDWWDAVDVSGEAIKTEISRLIDSTFGPGGLSAIQKQALEAAGAKQYDAQKAMKAAGEAAIRAISYADQPNSVLFKDALASRIAYENIAKAASNESTQIIKNAGVDAALVSKLSVVAKVLGPAINIAQLGNAAATGDAYIVGQKAVGVLAGMAFGALAVAFIPASVSLTVVGVVSIVLGFAGGNTWEWLWKNGGAEYYGINKGDKFDFDTVWGSVTGAVNTNFLSARNFVIQSDPLVLDLDGDGLELTGASGAILFDHNADNIKTGTGWAGRDDGFLVRDLNGNGTIDTGRELFGVDTIKSNNTLATQGFDALRDLDSNADGQITSADAAYGQLKVWQDANQDGISQSTELKTLAQQGITRIGLNGTSTGPQAGQTINNNQVALSTTFTRNGQTRTVGAIDLEANNFFTEFPPQVVDETGNLVAITAQAQSLPQMNGAGMVRNMRAAA